MIVEPQQSQVALSAIVDRHFEILKPPPRLKPSEWADQYRELSRESNAKGGKWRNLPMQIEPLDSFADPTVRLTVLMWASQTAGKTEVFNNVIGFFIHLDPCPIMMMQPTLDMGEAWSKDRCDPMFRDTAVLTPLIPPNSRDKQQTILHKRFPGGHLTVTGANSPSSLASRPIRVRLSDEIDRYPESAGDEGDPCALAAKRQDTFWNAVSGESSTPTVKGRSRIEKKFAASDQRYWFLPCHACAEWQTLKWENVKWPDGPELAFYECPLCHAHWSDAQRRANIARGEWRPTADFNGIRGYHINGIYSLFKAEKTFKNRLHQMVEEHLEAAKHPQSLKVWTNTFLAETYEAGAEREPPPDIKLLMDRREPYGPAKGDPLVPTAVRVLTAAVDVHKDRLEVEWEGWGEREECWGIQHVVLPGEVMDDAIWNELAQELSRKFRHELGCEIQLGFALIDAGKWPEWVFRFFKLPVMTSARTALAGEWKLAGRVRACRGHTGDKPHPVINVLFKSISTSKSIMGGGNRFIEVRGHWIGTNAAKEELYSRLKLTDPTAAGWRHFPESYSEEYFKQLTAETMVTKYVGGEEVRTFTNDGHARNEALDLAVYNLAAFRLRRWNFAAIGADMLTRVQVAKGNVAVPKKEHRRRSFLSDD